MSLGLLWSDLRLASRNAIKRPGFTLLVVLTLALGIGVNSAVFALLDSVLLRPLPYRDPSRLAFLWQTFPSQNVQELEPTAYDYSAWRALRSISALAMARTDTFTLTGGDNPERVRGSRVTSTMMPLLGVAPRLGRNFTPEEDLDGTAPVAILSDGLWRRRFGGDEQVLGRVAQIDGQPRTVVGVMPRGVSLPGPLAGEEDLWMPARLSAADRLTEVYHSQKILGRLADGVTVGQAAAELESLAARIAAERPSHRGLGARLTPIVEQTVRSIRPTLLLIAGSVGLLLLVACANASTLLLARASNRRHELAVRTALGATRGRILSLAIAESLVFAGLGGLAGLFLGGWALRAVLPLFAGSLPAAIPIDIDARVALFTAAISAGLGLLFGIVVAAHGPGGRLVDLLKVLERHHRRIRRARARRAGRRSSGARGRAALRRRPDDQQRRQALARAAGIRCRSSAHVQSGLDEFQLLGGTGTDRVRVRSDRGPGDDARRTARGRRIDHSLRRPARRQQLRDRRAPILPGQTLIADQRHISPGYFQTMNVPLIAGRGFLPTDDARAEPVVIVNKTLARRFWPNESPLDRRVRTGAGFDSGSWFRIVGVVDDVRHVSLSRDPVTEMYRPIAQTAMPIFTLVARTAGDPAAFAPVARSLVKAIDPDLPIYDVRTMEDRVAGSFAQTRATMMLLLVTAVLAAALSGVAIYGSIRGPVSQRIPEIGLRLALGASRGSVFVDVLRRAVLLTGIGAVIGVCGAFGGSRLMAGMLFETRATDPLTLTAVVAATMALAIVAGMVPARRAMSVDPMIALRN